MTHHFCTLFDSSYLYKGIALHESLSRTSDNFFLWVLCLDDATFDVLSRICLPNTRLIHWQDFEGDELRRLRGERTRQEYCWTCTSSLLFYLIEERPELSRLTYLDADLYFFSDPGPVLEAHAQASVLLSPHNYAPEYDLSARSGVYCVQFLSFRRDKEGLTALSWWRDRCLEWCFARFEERRFGDQKYLDDWPTRFERVQVATEKGMGVAPWNVCKYRIASDGGGLTVDGQPLVFYHFHEFELFAGGGFSKTLSNYHMGPEVDRFIYAPYVEATRRAVAETSAVWPAIAGQLRPQRPWTIPLDRLRRKRRSLVQQAEARFRPGRT